MPAIFRGINLNPLAAGNVTYLLWMIIGYLLVQSVVVVTLGRLADIFGRVKIYNLGFVVFTLASIALSLDPLTGAHGALWLILWRIVQAFGGSMLMANAAAILTDAFPPGQRGLALGTNQIAGISGQFIGLLLGGVLAAVDWRLVFWINVPIGLFGTIWAYVSLKEIAVTRKAKIDWFGNILFAAGAGLLLTAITFGIRPYKTSATAWASPTLTGGFLVAGPISGILSDKYGARPFATAGLLVAAACFVGLMLLPIDFPYPVFALLIFGNGVGSGLFTSPNTAAIMSSVPAYHRGAASGMRSTFQNSGMSLS
ncbi:MAG: MFS transporter, partial [Trebonia sp.]